MKPTTHQAGLLQDVCDNPGDDTPRLVYADWLEDNGDPQRAEFIRVHVEMAKLDKNEPRHAELFQRAQDLLMKNGGEAAAGAGVARPVAQRDRRRGADRPGRLGGSGEPAAPAPERGGRRACRHSGADPIAPPDEARIPRPAE